MGFPDRIERSVELPLSPTELWPVLTTAEGLSSWFPESADVDLRPGGAATMTWTETHAPTMRVEQVEEPRLFAFSWPLDENGVDTLPRTYVELTLQATADGTRLTVVESGFAQLPEDRYQSTYDGHRDGWERELGELVDHVLGLVRS
ncbi:vanillate O-demethylase oxidoreductase VanB [Marmoricola endophyticus]|uniref:Vanillate O-demethylase oxidoreductase VanB n=1 Tax=Marmoricola endophyticus TaxID=2040280 RepID=A0A917F209_9ACTN|nr:SRPBCC domain-containing protein [Marmoricola endophyticus]GGF42207.1 vanillate O-demethylase oxidoreductase VanB [Marmoricola endophyticus]